MEGYNTTLPHERDKLVFVLYPCRQALAALALAFWGLPQVYKHPSPKDESGVDES